MTRTILAACLLLTGCDVAHRMLPGPAPTLEHFEASCRDTPFASFGGCIRGQLNAQYPRWRADPHADLVDVYLAWLDAAGMRVASGTMAEPDARLGAAEMKVRLKRIASERATDTAIQQQAGISQMLAGLALLDASQPRPAYTPQIVCTTTEPIRGNMQTICH